MGWEKLIMSLLLLLLYTFAAAHPPPLEGRVGVVRAIVTPATICWVMTTKMVDHVTSMMSRPSNSGAYYSTATGAV